MGKLHHKKLGKNFGGEKEGIALIEGIKTKPKEFITGAGLATAGIYVAMEASKAMTQYSNEVLANLRPVNLGLELGYIGTAALAFGTALAGIWYLSKHNL